MLCSKKTIGTLLQLFVFFKYISIASIELIFLIRVGVLFLNFYSCIQVSKQQ